MRVWLVLEGMPKYQVPRSHRMAAVRAAMITSGTMRCTSARPEAMVVATWVPRRAPPKFRQADIMMALRADMTPVETTVAMELAVSWKPLM
jgi:hypothetical protein